MTLTPRRQIAGIAVPVSLEFLVILVANFLSQVIVGVLGATAIAAVGFANSIVFILIVTLGALGVSVSILIARAYGADRHDDMDHTITAAMAIAAAFSVAVALVPVLIPHSVLTVLGASATVADAGAEFLRLSALALVPTVLVSVLSSALRSTGRPRSPLVAALATVPVTTVLSYVLVTGWGPAPEWGVPGAGWAILITMTARLVILVVIAFGGGRAYTWSLPTGVRQWKAIAVPLLVLASPIALTEFLWSTGIYLYNVIAQQLGDGPLAAAQIVSTLESVFIVGSIGLMSATTALVGRSVGQRDAESAAAWVHRVTRAGIYTALVFGGLMALSALAVPTLFANAGGTVQALAVAGILINAAAQVVKVRNMILGAGVLPSGGDVRGVILGDAVSTFAVGIPLALVLSLATPLGLIGLFLARVIEELVKVAIFEYRARRISWRMVVERDSAVLAAL